MDAVVSAPGDTSLHERIAGEIRELCATFPAPGLLIQAPRSAAASYGPCPLAHARNVSHSFSTSL